MTLACSLHDSWSALPGTEFLVMLQSSGKWPPGQVDDSGTWTFPSIVKQMAAHH